MSNVCAQRWTISIGCVQRLYYDGRVDEKHWIPKSELPALLGVSGKTIDRRMKDLEPQLSTKEGKRVYVAREAVDRGLLGKTPVQLAEDNDLLRSTVAALTDDNERLRVQGELDRLHLKIDAQQREIETLRHQLEETGDLRDHAFDMLSDLTARLGSGGSKP